MQIKQIDSYAERSWNRAKIRFHTISSFPLFESKSIYEKMSRKTTPRCRKWAGARKWYDGLLCNVFNIFWTMLFTASQNCKKKKKKKKVIICVWIAQCINFQWLSHTHARTQPSFFTISKWTITKRNANIAYYYLLWCELLCVLDIERTDGIKKINK